MTTQLRSWQEENTIISTVMGRITMSTRLTNQGERSSATESPEEKRGSTSESWQTTSTSAQPNPPAGKKNTTVMTVMTVEETADLLAKLQDILALWIGSDNKVIGKYLLVAFPIPPSVVITKISKNDGHDKVFAVNDDPVVSLG